MIQIWLDFGIPRGSKKMENGQRKPFLKSIHQNITESAQCQGKPLLQISRKLSTSSFYKSCRKTGIRCH